MSDEPCHEIQDDIRAKVHVYNEFEEKPAADGLDGESHAIRKRDGDVKQPLRPHHHEDEQRQAHGAKMITLPVMYPSTYFDNLLVHLIVTVSTI